MLELFINEYYPAIADKIETQQNKYGLARIHSHRHISRCIIFADWYADLLDIPKEDEKRMQLYFAIAFHDMGREGELEDVWEEKSRQMGIDYLIELKLDKYEVNNNLLLSHIIHDVDCLDIMRSGAGRGGIMGFDRNYLILFRENIYLQEKMITNAWSLINLTDYDYFDNVDCLKKIYDLKFNQWK